MPETKENIIARLQKDILLLQGFKPLSTVNAINMGWGELDNAFPQSSFPTGAVHEFMCTSTENLAASNGFISGILATLMGGNGAIAWISCSRTLFPPALKRFGIAPERVIFIDLQKERDVSWAMEEALKCGALTAVVGDIKEISFTTSRRLQLAVEESQVTGFIVRTNARNLSTTACVSRWRITAMPSETEDSIPGIGFPRWKVDLLKIRNGKPGSWQLEWAGNSFRNVSPAPVLQQLERKTG